MYVIMCAHYAVASRFYFGVRISSEYSGTLLLDCCRIYGIVTYAVQNLARDLVSIFLHSNNIFETLYLVYENLYSTLLLCLLIIWIMWA